MQESNPMTLTCKIVSITLAAFSAILVVIIVILIVKWR